jgi:subtilisin family serine protease
MAQSEHATHVGGTLIAGGINGNVRGMAYQANLLANDWNNDESEMTLRAGQGLLVSNHSYGAICGWSDDGSQWNGDNSVNATYDYKFGYYDTRARNWDRLAFNAPYYLIVKSAGNSRGAGPNPPDPSHPANGPYDCLPTYSVAKNILTVGAVNALTNGWTSAGSVSMSTFSSWGPTDEGRIKPDVVGCGVNVPALGITNDNQYVTLSGTSMSGPSVAGSCLLLVEHYSNTHNSAKMRSSSLKGLVIHTADECFSFPGPDYRFGWGLMNTRKAADLISNDSIQIGRASCRERVCYSV